MNTVGRFVLIWAAVVLAFDSVASVASMTTGIPYGWFSLGSAVIYLAAGYVGAPRFGLSKAVAAVIAVALVDATLGWALSWLIGPGRIDAPDLSVGVMVAAGALGALVFGTVTGAVGGWVGLRIRGGAP